MPVQLPKRHRDYFLSNGWLLPVRPGNVMSRNQRCWPIATLHSQGKKGAGQPKLPLTNCLNELTTNAIFF